MASKEDSTGGTTPETEKVVQARTEVGGVRRSDDPVADLWSAQPAEERRDATYSAGEKSREGCGDGPRGLPAPEKVRQLQITLYRKAQSKPEYRFYAGHDGVTTPKIKELGKPDAGKPPVRFDEGREPDGHWCSHLSLRRLPPTLHSSGVPGRTAKWRSRCQSDQ